MKKNHVKVEDKVLIISGKWKNEKGKVREILNKTDRIVLEMTELTPEKKKQVGVKTIKKSRQNPKGGIVDRFVSVHISNVKIISK
jgi:large subunit ribosomal protein L24